MKSTGIVRRIDDLGRIVIPMEIRRTMGIATCDPLEIFVNGDNILLRKYVEEDRCATCHGYGGDMIRLDSSNICRSCAQVIAKVLKNA